MYSVQSFAQRSLLSLIIALPVLHLLSTWWHSRANEASWSFGPGANQLHGKLQCFTRLHLTITSPYIALPPSCQIFCRPSTLPVWVWIHIFKYIDADQHCKHGERHTVIRWSHKLTLRTSVLQSFLSFLSTSPGCWWQQDYTTCGWDLWLGVQCDSSPHLAYCILSSLTTCTSRGTVLCGGSLFYLWTCILSLQQQQRHVSPK